MGRFMPGIAETADIRSIIPSGSCNRIWHLIYSLSEYIMKNAGSLSPEFALLGFLYPKPDHGYDLHQKFLKELGYVWHLSQSQAYAIFKRIEQKGYISTQT